MYTFGQTFLNFLRFRLIYGLSTDLETNDLTARRSSSICVYSTLQRWVQFVTTELVKITALQISSRVETIPLYINITLPKYRTSASGSRQVTLHLGNEITPSQLLRESCWNILLTFYFQDKERATVPSFVRI